MGVPFVNRTVAALVVISGAAAAGLWSPTLIGSRPAGSAAGVQQPPDAVQMIPGGTNRVGARPGEKGATYYWLESRIGRVTTRFGDAVAESERGAAGDLQTRMTDLAGNELGHLRVDRIDDARHVVQYTTAKGDALQAMGRTGARPTLDWANQQAYVLWKDGVKSGTSLEWQGPLMRARHAAPRRVEDDIRTLDIEWPGGLVASADRRAVDRRQVIPGRVLHGRAVVSRLRRDGVDVGASNWFPEDRVFLWNLPGLTTGYFDPDILKPVGGWTFEPDMFWVNLQTIAFHHFKTLLNDRGVVAEHRAGLLEKIVSTIEPSLHADEPGCDGLHWLDGTIFRYCCDTHDLCYAKYGCTSYSWWQWWSSWQCDGCNLGVVYCFGGGHGIFSPYALHDAIEDRQRVA